MRTFIALEVNQKVREEIASVQTECRKIAPDVKWAKAGNIHITLKFLGEVAPEDIEKIEKAVKRATGGFKDFRVTFIDMGGFPNTKNPRVIWVGISEGKEYVGNLSEAISKELVPCGFLPEERPFIPHLTIARVKSTKNKRKLVQKIESLRNTDFGEGLIDRVLIIQSKLSPQGPCYSVLKEIKFNG